MPSNDFAGAEGERWNLLSKLKKLRPVHTSKMKGWFVKRSIYAKTTLCISKSLMEFENDVLCLTETWLMELAHDLVKVELPDSLSMVKIPRDSNGGGVAVKYHRSFSNVKVSILGCLSSFGLIEVSDSSISDNPGLSYIDMMFQAVIWIFF